MNCEVIDEPDRSDYCPCIPAKGDGTYDGAGGRLAQAVGTHATASRITIRLIVFTRTPDERSPAGMIDRRCAHVISLLNAGDFICNRRACADDSRDAALGALQRRGNRGGVE